MRRQLFSRLYTADKSVYFILKMIVLFGSKSRFRQCAFLCRIKCKFRTVIKSDSAFCTDKIYIHFTFAYILRPCAINAYNRSACAYNSYNAVLYVICTVFNRRTCPHIRIYIIVYVSSELHKGFSARTYGRWVAAAIHDNIKKMNSPIHKNSAAGNRLCRKRSAKPRNRPLFSEACVYMVNLAEFSGIYKLFYSVYILIEPVYNADIQNFSAFVLNLLHFKCFFKSSCRRLFAKNVFSGTQCVNRNCAVTIVRRTYGNCRYTVVF